MKRRILVLGAGGFIGRRVVAALGGCDWASPVAGYRRAPTTPACQDYVVVNAADVDALSRVVADVGAIVNCIAGNSETVSAVRAVSAAAARHPGSPTVVHLSTMSVYGSTTGSVDETHPLRGDLGPYSVAKIAAESAAAHYGQTIILRPSCVYGPGSWLWSERIAHLLAMHRVGDLGAAGDGYCNLVYIDDLVRAILTSLRTPAAPGQSFNVSNCDSLTWNDYFLLFARALGTVPIQRISERRMSIETRILAAPLRIVEMLQYRFGLARLRPAIPPSLARLWRQEIHLSGRKIEQTLGIQWTSLHDGLRLTAQSLGPSVEQPALPG